MHVPFTVPSLMASKEAQESLFLNIFLLHIQLKEILSYVGVLYVNFTGISLRIFCVLVLLR